MKKKDWFATKIKSDDKNLAYFATSTTPMVVKFITTATIDPNTDAKYVDYDSEIDKVKAEIDKLSKKILALEDKVKRLSDDVSFYTASVFLDL